MGVSLLFYFAGSLFLFFWLPCAILFSFLSHHTTSELGKSRAFCFLPYLVRSIEKRFLFSLLHPNFTRAGQPYQKSAQTAFPPAAYALYLLIFNGYSNFASSRRTSRVFRNLVILYILRTSLSFCLFTFTPFHLQYSKADILCQ